MRPFILAIILLLTSSTRATEYLVDASAPHNGDGSPDHPFSTIQPAIDRAKPGDIVTVRKGTYHEAITVAHGGSEDKPLIIRAQPIGSVTVDGAEPIKNFDPDLQIEPADKSKVWVFDQYHSNYIPMGNDYNLRTDWLKEGDVGKQQVELLSRNDMVWLDGQFLDLVDSIDQLRFGTFFVERDKNRLYICLPPGDKPEDHLIEASTLGTLFQGTPQASHIHLRGFHFTRGGFNGHPVVRVGDYKSQGWVVEDNIADWGNFSGFACYGRNHQILRNTVAHNGCEGMQGIMHECLLDGNSSILNNWKRIRDTYESGGGKFTECDHVTVRNHLAAWNLGPGLWFDINNTNITVENSKFHDNKYGGLFMEIAPGPTTIRGNTAWANSGGGIIIGESAKVLVENNICASNIYGIDLRNLQGRSGRFGDPTTGNEINWQTQDVTIRNNVLIKNFRAGIGNTCYYLDPAQERISSDNNIFWDNSILWWEKPDPKGPFAKMPTPPTVTTTVGNSWVFSNIYATPKFGGLEEHSKWQDPKFVNADMYNYPSPSTAPTTDPAK